MSSSVTVTIVTFNSQRHIGPCLRAVLGQCYRPLDVVVVDNASLDGTRLALGEFGNRIRLIQNDRNIGFAAAQNQAIAAATSDWVLALNPDVLLLPGFVETLVAAGQMEAGIGSVCGKLSRIGPDFTLPAEGLIDSAGIYFTPNLRHFDRGCQEPDDGRYGRTEYVFGASAAAALYRRSMIEDVSLEDGFFDPDFFAYREDADVAWRAQLLGWSCLYVPEAAGYHVRRVMPGNRRRVPAVLNMHSVKNRFLMRINNMTGGLYRRNWLSITARDLLIAGGCLFYEPSSLPAFWHVARSLPRALGKRSQIMQRKRASDEYLASWFQAAPAAQPAPEFALR
ncbi:MAG: glycosyltransferase family 2 protein [Acidobacteria bacterium]|nr:glycosyltransferase family 2 protein [Acidobacteriota bacterium]